MEEAAMLGSTFSTRLADLRSKLLTANNDAHHLSLEGLVEIAVANKENDVDIHRDNRDMLKQVDEYVGLMANKDDFVDVVEKIKGKEDSENNNETNVEEKMKTSSSSFKNASSKKKVLGHGQFAEVRLVRERDRPEALYAMKVISKCSMDVESARVERTAMASARSQWIVKLFFAFQDEEELYLIMQYCPGGDLRALMDRFEGPFELSMTRFYMAELTLALHAVHEMGFVHRDVKPENVLIDCFGHIKIADFGSVQPLKNSAKYSKVPLRPVGTPQYVSPEVLQCLEDNKGGGDSLIATEKSDFWSLGVIGYEMMTGGLNPFVESQTSSMAQIFGNIMRQEIKKLKKALEMIEDKVLRDLLQNLLKTEPKTRFGFQKAVRHDFFLSVDWDAISNTCPPFVPSLKSSSDTKYFNHIESVGDKNFRGHISPLKRRVSFKHRSASNTFVGFSYCGQHQVMSGVEDSNHLSELVASMRRQNEDLRKKIEILSKDQRKLNRQETSRSSLITKKESEDLQSTVSKLEDLLRLEREERAEAESKSLQLLASVKKRWESREEDRVAVLKTELNRAHKIKEECEKELESLIEIAEKDKLEIKRLTDVKQQLKAKLKESKDKYEECKNQLLKRDQNDNLFRKDEEQNKALTAEIKALKGRVKALLLEKEELIENSNNSNRELKLRVHALEFEVNHQRSEREQLKKDREKLSTELEKVKHDLSTTNQEKLSVEEELVQLKMSAKNHPITPARSQKENVLSIVNNDSFANEGNDCKEDDQCSRKGCIEMRETLKLHKVETRVAERRLKESEDRVKFLREVMIREEKEKRVKAEREVQIAVEELKELKSKHGELEKQKDRLEYEGKGSREELEDLKRRLPKLRLKEEECIGLRAEKDELTRRLATTEIEAKANSELNKRCHTMKTTCLELEDQITEYESVVGRLERKLKETATDLNKVKAECLKCSKENSELRISVNELRSELALSESKLNEMESKHQDVEEVYKNEEANWALRLENLTKTKREQKQALEELQHQLKTLSQNYEMINADYNDLSRANAVLTEESAGLKTNLHSLKESNLKLNSVMEEMLGKIESRNREAAELRRQLEMLRNERERREFEWLTQSSQLNKLIDHLRRELSDRHHDHNMGSILTPNPKRRNPEVDRMARSPTRTPRK